MRKGGMWPFDSTSGESSTTSSAIDWDKFNPFSKKASSSTSASNYAQPSETNYAPTTYAPTTDTNYAPTNYAPTTDTNYAQPSETNYAPTTDTNYAQPISDTNYAQPISDTNYAQPPATQDYTQGYEGGRSRRGGYTPIPMSASTPVDYAGGSSGILSQLSSFNSGQGGSSYLMGSNPNPTPSDGGGYAPMTMSTGGTAVPNMSLNNLASTASPVSNVQTVKAQTYVGGRTKKRRRTRSHRHSKSCRHNKKR